MEHSEAVGQVVELTERQHDSLPEIELIMKALRIAGSPEKLAAWMKTPIPSLNGQMPYSLLHSKEGREQVDAVLGRIEHGVY